MLRAETRELLGKYSGRGPRYTSYPTAQQFTTEVPPDAYRERLRGRSGARNLSIYVHIPFCAERCTYCGCHVIPTRRTSVAADYVANLRSELALLGRELGARVPIESLHLGGGTPTYLSPAELVELFEAIGNALELESAREVSIELDPRVTTEEHLRTLRDLGVTRVSIGVQDTSDEVQEAIGRGQSYEETRRCFERSREMGFEGVNVDLVYGLPLQTAARFERTLEDIGELRPDRMAIYGYAHVPWLRPQQKKIDPATLPAPDERIELCLLAHEKLTSAGYTHIGMDHFALEGDELARSQRGGTLGRNFMGYTPTRDSQIVGLGISSIGDLGDGYFQNEKKLSRYRDALGRGEFPLERGCLLSEDDIVRRYVITEILCNLGVNEEEFEERFGRSFEASFAPELERLREPERDGLVELEGATGIAEQTGGGESARRRVRVTPLGRFFLRNIAMVFDAYLERDREAGRRYSQTV